jgi:spore maturation protein CgeB
VLVPGGDVKAMTTVIQKLLNEDSLRQQIGRNAAQDAKQRFDLTHQAASYLEWYGELLDQFSQASEKCNPNWADTPAERIAGSTGFLTKH